MQLAHAAGATCMNGMQMLLYQGIIAYELWNVVTVNDTIARDIERLMEEAFAYEK